MMKKGCAFEVKDGTKSCYFTSRAVGGFEDFVSHLIGRPPSTHPLAVSPGQIIPDAKRVSGDYWHKLADNPEAADFAFYLIVDIAENTVWINEDRGDGMAYYAFPLSAVLNAAELGKQGLWERLLAQYPDAKKTD